MVIRVVEKFLQQEINAFFFQKKKCLEQENGVQKMKKMQRSSISILRISQQQRLVVQLQEIIGGGSAARTATAATISAMSARAAPALAARATVVASVPRSAFTDIFIPFYDRVCLK